MDDLVKTLESLKSRRQRLERELASAQGKMDSAQEQLKQAQAQLKQLGVSDVSKVESKLKSIQQDATALLQQIEEALPERYRMGS